MTPHKFPRVTGKQLIKALEKDGYRVTGQKGSHVRMRHPKKKPVTIPNHIIGLGLLIKIMRDSELSVVKLNELL